MADKKRKKKKNKKRMSCAARCAITLLVVFVISVGALFGGSMFAWKQFVQPKVGITMMQAFSLMGGIYKADEKEIVKEPHNKKDLDEFYSNLGEALFLDEEVDLKGNFSNVLISLLEKDNQEGGEQETQADSESTTTQDSLTGNEQLDNFLKEIKFDFSSLKDYEEQYASKYVLSLTGNQLGAFLDDAIAQILTSDAIAAKLPQNVGPLNLADINLSNAVKIPQVKINSKKIHDLEKVQLTLTVKLNIRDIATQAIEKTNPSLKFLTKIVPEKLFVTATVYPEDTTEKAVVQINAFDEKKKGELKILLDAILKSTSYQSFDGMMEFINTSVVNAIDKMNTSIAPIDFVTTTNGAAVQTKPMKIMMNAMKITDISETQFYCLIRDLKLMGFDDLKTVFFGEDALDLTREDVSRNVEMALDTFIENAENVYAVERGYLQKEHLYEQLTTIDSKEEGASNLKDHIKSNQLVINKETYSSTDHRLPVEYPAFVGILNSYLEKNPIVAGEGGVDLKYNILNASYNETSNLLALTIEIGLEALVENSSSTNTIVKDLMKQLIPDVIYATVYIDIENDYYATLSINGTQEEQTINHLNTITEICVSMNIDANNFSYEKLTTTISDAVKNGLEEVKTKLGTIIFEEDKMLFPTIYEVLSKTILEGDLTAGEVYGVIRGILTMQDGYENANVSKTELDQFIATVNNKYYLSEESEIVIPDAPEDTSISTQLSSLAQNYNSAIKGNQLASDWIGKTRTAEEEIEFLSPLATEGAMAALFDTAFTLEVDGLKNITIHQLNILDADTMEIVFFTQYDINPEDPSAAIMSNLIPDIYIYVGVDLNKINTEEICCSISINSLEGDALQNFITMCAKMSGTTIDLDSLRQESSDKIKENMNNLLDKVSLQLLPEQKMFKIASIYEVAAKSINNSDVNAINLADTISSLHINQEKKATNIRLEATPENGMVVTGTTNLIPPTTLKVTINSTLTANHLIDLINKNAMDDIADNLGILDKSIITIHQAAMFNMTSAENVEERDALINSLNMNHSYFDPNGAYLVITLRISDISKIGEKNNTSFASTLLPTMLDVTAIMDLNDETNKPVLLYNTLSSDGELTTVLNALTEGSSSFDLNNVASEIHVSLLNTTIITYTNESFGINMNITLGQVLEQSIGTVTNLLYENELSGKLEVTCEEEYTYTP